MGYDKGKLVSKLKENGMEVTEDAIQVIVGCALDWLAEEALRSQTPLDDFVAGLVPITKPIVMKALDRIDGKEG